MITNRERTAFVLGWCAAIAAVIGFSALMATAEPPCRLMGVQIVVFGDHATAVPDGVTVRWCKGAQTIRFSDPPRPVEQSQAQ